MNVRLIILVVLFYLLGLTAQPGPPTAFRRPGVKPIENAEKILRYAQYMAKYNSNLNRLSERDRELVENCFYHRDWLYSSSESKCREIGGFNSEPSTQIPDDFHLWVAFQSVANRDLADRALVEKCFFKYPNKQFPTCKGITWGEFPPVLSRSGRVNYREQRRQLYLKFLRYDMQSIICPMGKISKTA